MIIDVDQTYIRAKQLTAAESDEEDGNAVVERPMLSCESHHRIAEAVEDDKSPALVESKKKRKGGLQQLRESSKGRKVAFTESSRKKPEMNASAGFDG